MTGRGLGYCAGYGVPGFIQPALKRGLRLGYGFGGGGHGWRHMFYATGLPGWLRAGWVPPAPEQEVAALKAQADWLKDQRDAINKRIEEIEQKYK